MYVLPMRICIVLLFFLLSQKALCQDMYDWVNIDCGSATSYSIGEINWKTDDKFINTGTNKQVSSSDFGEWVQMNSLRVFTEQNKNCYTIPTASSDRYFIRGTFNYGNYDGLSKPPTFDFQIDGNKMKTIETSIDGISFIEVVHSSRGDNISVCLARVRDQEYPFISTLEVWPLADLMYGPMSRDLAWIMSYRYDYGSIYWTYGYPDHDAYNRWWEPLEPDDLNVVVANTTTLEYSNVEDPPDQVIFDAVEAISRSSNSINLSFEISKANSLNYILLYFTEMNELVDSYRSFDVYANNDFITNVIPEFQNCSEVNTYAHPDGNITIQLSTTSDSTLPPIISAIEIYTASDTLISVGMSQDDLDGLRVIIKTFYAQLKGWAGEPCLPNDTTWQWLGCVGNNPPRVTSLNLSGYGLLGSIPDFSVMRELEYIDLSNNNLDEAIPEFLGYLPNLKLLDLRGNNFSSQIPSSIVNNKNIQLRVDSMDPQKPPSKAYSAGTIVGIVIGVLFGIGIIIVLGLYLKPKILTLYHGHQVTQPPGPGLPVQHPPNQASPSINASTDPINRPHQNGSHMSNDEPISDGGFDPVHAGAGEASDPPPNMEPDMEMDEFDHAVQQHNVNPR